MKLATRARAAWRALREGPEYKSLPFAWPSWKQEQPEWHLVDLKTYIDEGYTLNSLVFSAIMYKVRATTTAPLRLYEGTEEDYKLVPMEDPRSQKLAHPNEYQSWTEFHARNIVFLNIAGDVYVYVDPDSGNMYSLSPERVYIIPNKGETASLKGFLYVPDGYSLKDGIPILNEEMLHIKLPNPADPLEGLGYGLSPLAPAAQVIDVDNMVTKFLNIFFKKGAMLTGVLKFDVPLKDDVVDKILERWENKYGGFQNWRTGILDRGGDYKRVGLTFDEMGFSEVDGRSESRILGPFGIAPILIGTKIGLDRSSYANYEAARQAVWEDTLIPEMRWFEVEYQSMLNTDTTFVQFDYSFVPALQRGLARQTNAAWTLIQAGVPPNKAFRTVGLRISTIPNGDEPLQLGGPGVQQGPRADEVREGWGRGTDQVGERDGGGDGGDGGGGDE